MFWQVMLRWESSAGLGAPVLPVVKITSAPSFSSTAAVISANAASRPSGRLPAPSSKKLSAPSMVSSGGENWMNWWTKGQCRITARPSSLKSAARVRPRNA